MKMSSVRPDVLDGAPLRYAPENELGVVFLFADFAKRWRLRVDEIRPTFPDCIAYQKTYRGEKRVRIEFEYRSSNFLNHCHDARKCDWIVCWEHDWAGAPRRLNVIELRREFGLGFNVWITSVASPHKEALEKRHFEYNRWTTAHQAHKGDLVLLYSTYPQQHIANILVLRERPYWQKAGYKKGKDYRALVKRLCALKSPVFLEDLQKHRILSTAPFVRCQMQGRHSATEYWPFLYDIIVRRNPSARAQLRRYAPQRI